MRLSLKYKFLIPVLIMVMIGMVSLSMFAHYNAKTALARAIRGEITRVANTTANAMSVWVSDRKLDMVNWCEQGIYKNALAPSGPDIAPGEAVDIRLRRIKKDYGYYKNIILADRNGRIVAAADQAHAHGIGIRGQPFFEAALNGEVCLSDQTDTDAADARLMLMVSAPVSGRDGIIGVLLSVLDVPAFFRTFILPIGAGEHSDVYIITGNGLIVSNPDRTGVSGRRIHELPFAEKFMSNTSGELEHTLSGQPVFASYQHVSELDWTVVVCAGKQAFVSPMVNFKRLNLFSTVTVGILLFMVLFMISESFSRPVRKMAEGLRLMGQGNPDVRLRTDLSDDEIGEIGQAFNEMAENLDQSKKKITEQNRLLEERTANLKQAEKNYNSIFNNAVEGIFQISAQGLILNANPSLARILGYPDADMVVDRYFHDIVRIPGETRETFDRFLAAHKKIIAYEARLNRKDGTPFWCYISARKRTRRKTGEECYEGFVVDITQRREMESVKREREVAEAANQAKSEFLANMSHEIRTPLNALLGFSELLANDIKNPRQQAYTDAIKVSGKSLLTLINDVLDLSKIEAGRLELSYGPVSIPELFEEIEQIFRGKVSEKQLSLVMTLAPDLPDYLELDKIRIRQILLNLVGNAVKFTQKGRIEIAVSTSSAGNRAEESPDMPDKTSPRLNLTLAVSDTGPGIASSHLEIIFESFRQGDGHLNKPHGGTGLGLTICKRLVQAMNGTITVDSAPGRGSRFEVCLRDVAISESAARKPAPDSSKHRRFRQGLVLVVDDEIFNRYMLSELLTKFNQSVIEAENGERAVALAREEQPDIIIMDVRMPVMDGNEATRILKSDPDTADIPVLALTGDLVSLPGSSRGASQYDGCLPKPVEKDALLHELSRFLPPEPVPAEPVRQPSDFLDDLRPDTISDPERLIYTLESELLPRCYAFDDSLVISRVADYAEELKQTADRYHLKPLAVFSQDLLHSAAVFDITRIQENLVQLPGLIRDIIHRLRKGNHLP